MASSLLRGQGDYGAEDACGDEEPSDGIGGTACASGERGHDQGGPNPPPRSVESWNPSDAPVYRDEVANCSPIKAPKGPYAMVWTKP